MRGGLFRREPECGHPPGTRGAALRDAAFGNHAAGLVECEAAGRVSCRDLADAVPDHGIGLDAMRAEPSTIATCNTNSAGCAYSVRS